jgi:hypothetical protein
LVIAAAVGALGSSIGSDIPIGYCGVVPTGGSGATPDNSMCVEVRGSTGAVVPGMSCWR